MNKDQEFAPAEPSPKMTKKGWALAAKDFFPTPQLANDQDLKDPVCFAGPGITIREWMATEMMKALIPQAFLLSQEVDGGESLIAEKAVRLAEALCEHLANNEPERED